MTVSRPSGMSTETFLRLWVRAPRMRMGEGRSRFGVFFKPTNLPESELQESVGRRTVASAVCGSIERPPRAGASGHAVVGAVPSMKTSRHRLRGQPGAARKPVSGSISAVTMSEGTGKGSAKCWAGHGAREVREDRHGRLRAREVQAAVVVVADPDGREKPRREPDEPGVAAVVRRARLARRARPSGPCARAPAARAAVARRPAGSS